MLTSANSRDNDSKKGWRIPAPAPWASTKSNFAVGGRNKRADTLPAPSTATCSSSGTIGIEALYRESQRPGQPESLPFGRNIELTHGTVTTWEGARLRVEGRNAEPDYNRR